MFLAIACCGFTLNFFTHWGLTGYPGIVRGLSEFLLGCATAGFHGSPVAQWLQGRIGSVLAFAALVLCFLLTPDTGFIIGFCTAPLLLALCGNNAVVKLFDNRPVFFLGEISYSIYLGHFLFSTISYRLISVPWMQTGPVPLFLGACFITLIVIGASTLTYYAVERPGRDLLRGRKKPAERPAAAMAGGASRKANATMVKVGLAWLLVRNTAALATNRFGSSNSAQLVSTTPSFALPAMRAVPM